MFDYVKKKDIDAAFAGIQDELNNIIHTLDHLEELYESEAKELKKALRLMSEPVPIKEDKRYIITFNEESKDA